MHRFCRLFLCYIEILSNLVFKILPMFEVECEVTQHAQSYPAYLTLCSLVSLVLLTKLLDFVALCRQSNVTV